MTYLPLRELSTSGESVELYEEWLAQIGQALEDTGRDRNELVGNVLREIYLPALSADVDESRLPAASRAVLAKKSTR